VGEAELVKMIFEWDRFPGDVALLAAPDLAAAVGFFSETVDRANPPLNVALDEKSDPTRISISIDEKIAPFRALYEQVTVAVLFRVLRSYLSHREGSIEDLRQIEIGLVSSTETIARCVPSQVGEAQGESFISIPQDTLAAANCNFSPELWGELSARNVRFRERRGGGARRGHDAVKSTEAALIISLSDYSRVPRFTEVALSLNCSERTLARDLAKAGTSYRALVDRVRMDMARDFLLRGKLSVTEVAMRLGYGDATAFVRSFKRHFGTSPARWCRREALESLKGSIAV
jgi:AraC-like DNA-binding protein